MEIMLNQKIKKVFHQFGLCAYFKFWCCFCKAHKQYQSSQLEGQKLRQQRLTIIPSNCSGKCLRSHNYNIISTLKFDQMVGNLFCHQIALSCTISTLSITTSVCMVNQSRTIFLTSLLDHLYDDDSELHHFIGLAC